MSNDQNALYAAGPQATPMMAQYMEIKAANPDCLLFYRMGDFYELFFGDAETASKALGIVLTKRGKHFGEDIPMCGVPIERSDEYLHRLIALGHRVAICEQTEDPAEARKRGPKSVVRRAVVRLVTPGTLTEESLLNPRRANVLIALARVRDPRGEFVYGFAAADISTGSFVVGERGGASLAAEVAKWEPAEIVAAEALREDSRIRQACEAVDAPLTLTPRGSEASPDRLVCEWFGVSSLDGFGAFARAETAAAATALAYLARTQINSRPALSPPTRADGRGTMQIDAATRANLEITKTQAGGREGSLLDVIDFATTPAGGRLLAERIANPSSRPDEIRRRLDAVSFFVAEPELRAGLRAILKATPDLSRALSRLAIKRAGPRDLAAIRDGLGVARKAAKAFESFSPPEETAADVTFLSRSDRGLEKLLEQALAENLPLDRRDGGFIRLGFSSALDSVRALRDQTRGVIAGLQAKYCEELDIKQLKIKHNSFLGYFIEVPSAAADRLMRPPAEKFRHRQTMADAMRFSTLELSQLESEIATAASRALALELEAFESLSSKVIDRSEEIRALVGALSSLDAASALAETAVLNDWSRPEVDDTLAFSIEGGRHPVVEAALRAAGKPFVANNCDLSDQENSSGAIAVMTGPNMAGKSTFLRQNALIVILAQAGSFVPARHARIGVVDRLFSRVGAADDLARGRSTFMVEMVETAAILNQATERSFVILDEIGRGTATFDGLSIAWAAVEHLHDEIQARALFATHFHELTQLARKLPRLKNLTMRVTEWKGDVVFLHEVIHGSADRSYGIQVAKLAGLPPRVVRRAQQLLSQLEAEARTGPVQSLLDDLPLFSLARRPELEKSPVLTLLSDIDPDSLSPRQALEALYRLKATAEEIR